MSKTVKLILFVVCLAGGVYFLSACSVQAPLPTAALAVEPVDSLATWGIPQKLQQQGSGNSYRVLETAKGKKELLELAAGNQGSLVYNLEEAADSAVNMTWRLQFLSTQGTGRIVVSALDATGNTVATVGMVFTGDMPASEPGNTWLDMRYNVNYKGAWLEQKGGVQSFLLQYFTPEQLAAANKYRLRVETAKGQHVLIDKLALAFDTVKGVKVTAAAPNYQLKLGEELTVKTQVENNSTRPIQNLTLQLVEPYGFGLLNLGAKQQTIGQLQPGEKQELVWKIRAQRPDSVNLGKPWTLGYRINQSQPRDMTHIGVTDTRPGKVFYVMTEDLEPIDAAGYPVAWGNANGWLDPEEFQVQLIQKAEKLNQIAEEHGAKWTHYIAWPAIMAAQWADRQSSTGAWGKVVADIEQSVRRGAAKGHEYSIHMHSDYDPYLPGNVLSYNKAVDGFWADHLKHGWAHSIPTEGEYNKYDSRVGILYAYQRIIEELAADSPGGEILTSRAGSFDFGADSADQARSISAYHKIGLWGSSDADGNIGGMTSGEYGKEIYFTRPDDINHPATDIKKLGIVEFRPTPRQPIDYHEQSASLMNQKADEGMAYFTANATIKPGIHAIVGFVHAMFMMGDGDWHSTEGGQFAELDKHLGYLQQTYVDKGLLQFATGSELVRAYLDYYTPQLMAVYGKKIAEGWGVTQYQIRLLGQDIPVDSEHKHQVRMKYPIYLRDSAYRIVILKNGQAIYSTWGLPTPYNDIVFTVDDKTAGYTLKVYHNPLLAKLLSFRNLKRW